MKISRNNKIKHLPIWSGNPNIHSSTAGKLATTAFHERETVLHIIDGKI